MNWTVRRGTVPDVEGVKGLGRGLPELPHWNEAEYARYVLGEGAGHGRLLLVAEREEDARLLGFAAAVWRPAPVDVVELESLGVEMESRRLGVARSLCEAMVAWARGCGAERLELEVRSRSEGAMALYRAVGFVAGGLRRGYYAEPVDDAVLMAMTL